MQALQRFSGDQHQAPDAAHQRGDQLVLSLFLGCMEPPLGASGCDSGLCSIILSGAALQLGNERATSSCAGFICNPMARDERLEPAVKPVGLKRDRPDQAGAPRGLSALPRSIAQPGRIRPWLVPRRRHPRRLSNGPRSPPQQHVVVPIVIGWLLNLLLKEGSLLRCIIGYFASAPSAASAQLKRLSQSGLRMS